MITSVQNETIKEIMKLKQKKYRDETGLFLVEGYHLVEEAKKHHAIIKLITTDKQDYDEETIYVSSRVMEKLAFTKTPQPIMAICQKKDNNHILLNKNRYLLLDCLQDPGNVGTLLRTAIALGYDQVIMSKDCVDLYNDKVIRATQGALFMIDVCMMDLNEAISSLQNDGVTVYGTCLENAKVIDDIARKDRMAFVMGNEGQGISKEILDICDERMYIPIQTIESLNVAVAGALAMYHFR